MKNRKVNGEELTFIEVKVNSPGLIKELRGSNFDIQTDKKGVPLSRFWRRRLRDSITDNCCEVVELTPTEKPSEKKAKQTNDIEEISKTEV